MSDQGREALTLNLLVQPVKETLLVVDRDPLKKDEEQTRRAERQAKRERARRRVRTSDELDSVLSFLSLSSP